ncbi:MAG: tail fiber domain-containing protein [Deltaproteobacteria bacterium]|nr:tail fiber domain-containing protein [Deltaproteobacteria bacterium]
MIKKNGFSLTGVLIATGIGALIFGFIADMVIYQYKDQKHLSQKLEMTDFANTLIATFAKPGNCTCQFINNATNPNLANFGALHFDSTNVSGTESISVNKLFSGCLGGANPPILLAANNQPLHGSQDLIVDTVKLINLKPSGGGANPNDWQGQWQVIFKVASGSLNKPSPPVMVTQKFTIDPTVPTVALISSCNGISSGTGTTNFLAKWSGITGMLMDSGVYEDPLLKKIGIGTTTPTNQLEIVTEGPPFQTRSTISTYYSGAGPHYGGSFLTREARGTMAAPTAVQTTDQLGYYAFQGYDGTGFFPNTNVTGITSYATENWTPASRGSNLAFLTTANGSSIANINMTIASNGNVGIGTRTPDDTLEVVFGSGRGITATKFGQVGARGGAVQVRGSRGTQAAPSALLANDYLGWVYGEGYSGAGFTSHATPTGMAIETTENWNATNNGSRLSFFTIPNGTANGLERMTVQENGNVGIGTTTPQQKLDVNGTIRFGPGGGMLQSVPVGNFGGKEAVLTVADGLGGANDEIWIGPNTGGYIGHVQINASTIHMNNSNAGGGFILTGDKVGIGTAAPGFKLEVNGTAYAAGAAGALSDSRHKQGILPLSDDVLDQVLKLNPVKFEWINPKDKGMQGTQMGFVAQEVQQLFPSMILTSSNEEKTLGIKYNEMTALFVKAFQQFFQLWMNDVEKKTDDILRFDTALENMRTELEQAKQDNLILKNYICNKDPKAIFCSGH